MTLWTAARQASLSFTISQSLHKFMSIELVMPPDHLILCCSLLLLPSIFPRIRVFPNESALHIRWPKYCSFSFSISSSNEYSGLVSFRIDCFDLLTVQGTLKSLLQHCNLKASILQCSSFFVVHFSHLYMTTKKTTALIIWLWLLTIWLTLLAKWCLYFLIQFVGLSSLSSKEQMSFNFVAAVAIHSYCQAK